MLLTVGVTLKGLDSNKIMELVDERKRESCSLACSSIDAPDYRCARDCPTHNDLHHKCQS